MTKKKKPEERIKTGRPTDYRPEYCDMIVKFMAEGYSATAFAGTIGVCRDTITEWVSKHPEFSLAFKKGKTACAGWWEKTNRINAMSGAGNAASCIFGLKNMAPDEWHDKTTVSGNGADGSLTIVVKRFSDVNAEADSAE